jgi:ABC-type proline/glycine betaine transport system permease subunit
MRPGLGTILRLVGPLIQVVCVIAMLQVRGLGYRVLGQPAETVCWGGFAAGAVLVLVGIVLSRRVPKPRDKWDLPREST